MQQPGYISGETLHGVDDPNYYLVISTWESLRQWQDWFNNPERRKLSAQTDSFLQSPTQTRVMTNLGGWSQETSSSPNFFFHIPFIR